MMGKAGFISSAAFPLRFLCCVPPEARQSKKPKGVEEVFVCAKPKTPSVLLYWALVREFNLSYHNKETFFSIDSYYGNSK